MTKKYLYRSSFLLALVALVGAGSFQVFGMSDQEGRGTTTEHMVTVSTKETESQVVPSVFPPPQTVPISQVSEISHTSPTEISEVVTSPQLRVALSSRNPKHGTLISNTEVAAVRVPVLGIDFTARGGDLTLRSISFEKRGVLSDHIISGAYLVAEGGVIVPYQSLHSGTISFSGFEWSIKEGETRTLWLAIDPTPGLTPGNSVGFQLADSSKISLSPAAAIEGNFPIVSNPFTITSVTNPDLASLSISELSIGTEILSGTENALLAGWNFRVSGNRALLSGLTLREVGEIEAEAFSSLRLVVNSREVAKLPAPSEDKVIHFDFSDGLIPLTSGSNIIQLYGNLGDAPGDEFQFQILHPYDVSVLDGEYRVPIAGEANEGTEITIPSGQLILTTIPL